MPLRKRSELTTNAREKRLSKVIIPVSTWLEIIKTELVSAIAARHVIAPFVLVDSDRALRAVHCTCFLLPLFKLDILLTLSAFVSWVRFHSAGEANTSHTVITDNIFDRLLWVLSHVTLTGGLGTPSQVWVKIHHGISLETHELAEQITIDAIADFILPKLLRAAVLHAAYIHDFALIDLTLQILLIAQLAKLMLTSQTVEVLLFDIFVAHLTCFSFIISLYPYNLSYSTILILFRLSDCERLSRSSICAKCLISVLTLDLLSGKNSQISNQWILLT